MKTNHKKLYCRRGELQRTKLLTETQLVYRRFDWPAFLRALGNRPDKSPPR